MLRPLQATLYYFLLEKKCLSPLSLAHHPLLSLFSQQVTGKSCQTMAGVPAATFGEAGKKGAVGVAQEVEGGLGRSEGRSSSPGGLISTRGNPELAFRGAGAKALGASGGGGGGGGIEDQGRLGLCRSLARCSAEGGSAVRVNAGAFWRRFRGLESQTWVSPCAARGGLLFGTGECMRRRQCAPSGSELPGERKSTGGSPHPHLAVVGWALTALPGAGGRPRRREGWRTRPAFPG